MRRAARQRRASPGASPFWRPACGLGLGGRPGRTRRPEEVFAAGRLFAFPFAAGLRHAGILAAVWPAFRDAPSEEFCRRRLFAFHCRLGRLAVGRHFFSAWSVWPCSLYSGASRAPAPREDLTVSDGQPGRVGQDKLTEGSKNGKREARYGQGPNRFARFEQPVHVPGADPIPLRQVLDDFPAASLATFGQFTKFMDQSVERPGAPGASRGLDPTRRRPRVNSPLGSVRCSK